jgi:hypothetical protein
MNVRPNRKDPPLSKNFAKDSEKESFLAMLNETLATEEEAGYEPNLPEDLPTLQVMGLPRSGSTLLTQLIASELNVTCINNLTAAFWAAPVYGIQLSKHLGITCPRRYASNYGRTDAIGEPHEFGYFWSRVLGFEEMLEPTSEEIEMVDWKRFRLVMTNMLRAAGRPIVFKASMFAYYMEKAVETMPRTCFIRMVRDPLQTACSIYKGRKEYLSSPDAWYSMKPKEYSWLQKEDIFTQIAGQVFFIDAALDHLLAKIPRENQLAISYRELCETPIASLERIVSLANSHGASVEMISKPAPFTYREYDANRVSEVRLLGEKLAELQHKFGFDRL